MKFIFNSFTVVVMLCVLSTLLHSEVFSTLEFFLDPVYEGAYSHQVFHFLFKETGGEEIFRVVSVLEFEEARDYGILEGSQKFFVEEKEMYFLLDEESCLLLDSKRKNGIYFLYMNLLSLLS